MDKIAQRDLSDIDHPLSNEARAAVNALARRWKRANGPVMSLLSGFGGKLEDKISALPEGLRTNINSATEHALTVAWKVARQGEKLPGSGDRGTLAVAMASGAAGGAAGFASAMAELPFTVTVLLHAIRREAQKAGFDPEDPWIMAECLRTFGSGSPSDMDDGVNTGFFSARLALTGPAMAQMIRGIAPRFAAALGQKLAAQTVPVIGAVTGAALNAAFLRYYREMAAIRFSLLRLAESEGHAPVLASFDRATANPKLMR